MTRRRGLAVLVTAAAFAATQLVAAKAAPPAGPYVVPVASGRPEGAVFSGDRVYALNKVAPDRIEVLNLATGALEAPIPVDTYARTFAVTADGRSLYVVNEGLYDSVSVIDVATRHEVRRIILANDGVTWSHDSIAIAGNGKALILRTGDLANGPGLVQLDLTTDAVTPRADWTGAALRLAASGDRGRIGVTGAPVGGNGGVSVALYDAATDRFGARRQLSGSPAGVALDRTGATVLVGDNGFVLGADMALRATLYAWDAYGYTALHPAGTTVYKATDLSGTVQVIDVARGIETGRISLPSGQKGRALAVTPDGTKLVLTGAEGFTVVPTSGAVTTTCPLPAAPAGVLPVCGAWALADVVLDGNGRAYASNAARNQIEVVNLATGRLEAPIPVGSGPSDLDVTADGRTLVAVHSGADEVSFVDLATRRESRRVVLPTVLSSGDQPAAVAVAANGTALVATREPNLGAPARLLQVDLATGAVRPRPEQAPRFLAASGDHTKILGAPLGDGVALYSSAADSFGPSQYVDGDWYSMALDRTGASILVGPSGFHDVPGEVVLDGDLVRRAKIPDAGLAVAVNPSGTIGYRLTGSEVFLLDVKRGVRTSYVSLPELSGAPPGRFAVTGDGARAVVVTTSGVAVVSLAAPKPAPTCVPRQMTGLTPVCGGLGQVVIDGANQAWAANPGRNEVAVVDLATGAVTAAIPVGSLPTGLDFSRDGTLLYVADSGSQEISVVDVALRKEVRRITVASPFDDDRPTALEVAANGRVLYTTAAYIGSPGHLWELDPVTGATTLRAELAVYAALRATPDRSRVAVRHGLGYGEYLVYSSATGAVTASAGAPAQPELFGFDQMVSVDGRTAYRLAFAAPAKIEVVNLAAGSAVTRTMVLSDFPYWFAGQIAVSGDGKWLAIVVDDGLYVYATQSASLKEPASETFQAGLFDGAGAWMGMVNEPVAAPGQHAPSYLYAHFFGFPSSARGVVGLVADATGKYAVVSLVSPEGVPQSAIVPFNWTPGNYYFVFVYELAPGQLGAWVYDNTAGAWTGIGVLTFPAGWGKLLGQSETSLRWLGRPAATCASYPRADVVMYGPQRYVGSTALAAGMPSVSDRPGDCATSATTSTALGAGWIRYQAGQ